MSFILQQSKTIKLVESICKRAVKKQLGEGPGGDTIQGEAEFPWSVQPGGQETEGRPHCSLQLPREGKQRDRH